MRDDGGYDEAWKLVDGADERTGRDAAKAQSKSSEAANEGVEEGKAEGKATAEASDRIK